MSAPGDVVDQFADGKQVAELDRLGNGHINDTYRITFRETDAEPVVLQRVNHLVFPDVPGMMANIRRVTDHQHAKLTGSADAGRRALSLVQTLEGKDLLVDEEQNYWRAFRFIPDVCSIDVVDKPSQVYQAARAFGAFQAQLSDLEGSLLDTIPHFHHTPSRLAALEASFEQDLEGRAKAVSAEMRFIRSHRDLANCVVDLLEAEALPLRVTHNDTKINNVLFDSRSGEGVCVIDLDTVMSGSLLYDFGDLVRTATSLADEDEKDLSKIQVEMDLFAELVRGFLETANGFITPAEKELLPVSGALISYELGTRFLKDYLDGDLYFKVAYPEHNLIRARAQFRRAEEILELEKEMTRLVREI